MNLRLNKIVYTSHVTFSVGWFGAVAVFLVLAITGIASQNPQVANGAYLAMKLSAWFIIVPFCIASLLTGIIQSFITKWGLLRHYWIVVKLILTVASTILLLLHLNPIGYLANTSLGSNELISEPGLQIQMIATSGAALIMLLALITISIYKPWGKTSFAVQVRNNSESISQKNSRGKALRKYFLIGIAGLIIIIMIKHLAGGGMHGH